MSNATGREFAFESIGWRDFMPDPLWGVMRRAVESDASPEVLLGLLRKLTAELLRIGIRQPMIASIELGLMGLGWHDAVAAFGEGLGEEVAFYMGPMRSLEGRPASMGCVLLVRTPGGGDVVNRVRELAQPVGDALFGYGCDYLGRQVEFVDLIWGAGPFFDSKPVAVALFAPFYFDGWEGNRMPNPQRRTLLFHNVALDRFQRLANPMAEAFFRRVDASSSLHMASNSLLSEALMTWLALHELMHSSGPLPLFTAPPHKLDPKQHYGSIEEMRVDMSAWLALSIAADTLGEVAWVAREMIVAERIFRSACVGCAEDPPNSLSSSIDGVHGALWLACLAQAGAVYPSTRNSTVEFDMDIAETAILGMLTYIYENESLAAQNPSTAPDILRQISRTIHGRLFETVAGSYRLPQVAMDVLAMYLNRGQARARAPAENGWATFESHESRKGMRK